jgi:hypothetical protein
MRVACALDVLGVDDVTLWIKYAIGSHGVGIPRAQRFTRQSAQPAAIIGATPRACVSAANTPMVIGRSRTLALD